jgi:hypothetical protein
LCIVSKATTNQPPRSCASSSKERRAAWTYRLSHRSKKTSSRETKTLANTPTVSALTLFSTKVSDYPQSYSIRDYPSLSCSLRLAFSAGEFPLLAFFRNRGLKEVICTFRRLYKTRLKSRNVNSTCSPCLFDVQYWIPHGRNLDSVNHQMVCLWWSNFASDL